MDGLNLPTEVFAGTNIRLDDGKEIVVLPTHRSARAFYSTARAVGLWARQWRKVDEDHWDSSPPTRVLRGTITWEEA